MRTSMMFSQIAQDDFEDLFATDEVHDVEIGLKMLAISSYHGFDQPQTGEYAWLCPLANLSHCCN